MRAHDLDWSEDSLRRVLHELRAYPSRDGTGLALVQASADEGPWRTTEF
jgi:hypothetical protein